MEGCRARNAGFEQGTHWLVMLCGSRVATRAARSQSDSHEDQLPSTPPEGAGLGLSFEWQRLGAAWLIDSVPANVARYVSPWSNPNRRA